MRFDLCLPLRTRDELLRNGTLDPRRWRSALVDNIVARDPGIGAFTSWDRACRDDRRLPAAPTVAYKDTIDVAGFPTRLGIVSGYRHDPHRSARVVTALSRAGFVCLGKTATTEVSIGTRIPSRNPRHPGVSAGGSSSGAGAAVAAGFCDLGVGTDSGGSIRWPAVYCGAVGLRLTHDPAWLDGLLPVAPSMESVGLVTRTADDLHHLWHGHGLSTLAARRDVPDVLRVGVIAELDDTPMHPEVRAAYRATLDRLTALGHPLVAHSPSWWNARADAWDLLLREAHDVHATRDVRRYEQSTRNALDRGSRVDDRRLAALHELRASVRFADGVDVVVLPLDPHLADRPPDDRRPSTVPSGDPGFTIAASFAGLPVVALPVARARDGSPLGIQIVARPHHEDLLVAAARMLEQPVFAPTELKESRV